MTAQNIGATVVFIMVDIVVLELLWSLHPAKGGGPGEPEAGGRPAFRRFMARVAALSLASVLVVFLVWTVKEKTAKNRVINVKEREVHFAPKAPFPLFNLHGSEEGTHGSEGDAQGSEEEQEEDRPAARSDTSVAEVMSPSAVAALPKEVKERSFSLRIGQRYKYVTATSSSWDVDYPVTVYSYGATPSLPLFSGVKTSQGTLRGLVKGEAIIVEVSEPFCAVTGVQASDPDPDDILIQVYGIKDAKLCGGQRLSRGWVVVPLAREHIEYANKYRDGGFGNVASDGTLTGKYFPTVFRRKDGSSYMEARREESQDRGRDIVYSGALYPYD